MPWCIPFISCILTLIHGEHHHDLLLTLVILPDFSSLKIMTKSSFFTETLAFDGNLTFFSIFHLFANHFVYCSTIFHNTVIRIFLPPVIIIMTSTIHTINMIAISPKPKAFFS